MPRRKPNTVWNQSEGRPVLLDDHLLAFLNARRHPARLTIAQSAALLGFTVEQIVWLMKLGLLRPLGAPCVPNSTKWFSSAQISALAQDHAFLDKATRALTKSVRDKNNSRKPHR